MKAGSIISVSILMATVVGYFAIIPASVTVHVGDDGDRVSEIGRYGYAKSRFSVIHGGDKSLHPTSFRIGPAGYHLLIWHNDKIDSITYFRHEAAPNTYGDWHDVTDVDSFTVDRPSPNPFFLGMAILGVTGYLLRRSRRTSIALFTILVLFEIIMVFRCVTLAETIAIQPMLVAAGWLAAAILGRSISRTITPDSLEVGVEQAVGRR